MARRSAGITMKTSRVEVEALQLKKVHERADKQNFIYWMSSGRDLADGFTKKSPDVRGNLGMCMMLNLSLARRNIHLMQGLQCVGICKGCNDPLTHIMLLSLAQCFMTPVSQDTGLALKTSTASILVGNFDVLKRRAPEHEPYKMHPMGKSGVQVVLAYVLLFLEKRFSTSF